ncbi:MAG: hypothetical protein N2260_03770 [Syntrophobacterales bacterium]|nr:hypothetical protein [Syntrophobacterales bacterium]
MVSKRLERLGVRVLLSFVLILAIIPLPRAGGDRIYRMLVLDSQEGYPYNEVRASLFDHLREYGYEMERNLVVKIITIGNDIEYGERILHREVENNYDVIFVGGTAATVSANRALYGKEQPVVFGSPTDPVGIGVIRDFKTPPQANFTGVSYPVPVRARLKFVKQLMPGAKTFGFIYADMPQSHSYRAWLEDLLKNDPEFRDIKIIFKSVSFVKGETGDILMAEEAGKYIEELDPLVDAYIKPCDQMGTRRNFSEVVYRISRKPLIGLVKDDVMGGWGATAVVYPSHESIGYQAARMIKDIFRGKKVRDILPEWPRTYGFAVDLVKAKQFGIVVPVEILQLAGENIIHYKINRHEAK